jgi:hypothetical protein
VLGRYGIKATGEPAVNFSDRAGNSRAGRAVSGDGGSGLSLFDADVSPRVRLAAGGGAPELVFKRKDGEEIWKAP